MFGFKGIHHIAISVPSLEEAKAFYVDTLGFDIVDQARLPSTPEGDRVLALDKADSSVLMVQAGNLFLEIFEFHHPTPGTQHNRPVCDHGYTHLAFEVEDIYTAYAFLQQAGVQWHSPPIDAGENYMMTYGRDPFGNVIEIQQLGADLPYSLDQLRIPQVVGEQ